MKHQHILLKLSLAILLASCVWPALHPTPTHAQDGIANDLATRDLTFTNGDVRLAGTLYLPAGEGPFPAAVVLHGAGAETRAPYVPDAEMLAAGGVAAFVFDKRGTGQSTGDWQRASLDDLMADGLAAVALLQDQPGIDPAQVGLVGSSQGAWLAPFVAARDERVAFFVQITGSATPLANQEMWGSGNALHALGFSDRAIATAMKAHHLLYSGRDLIRRGILPLGDLWFVYYDPTLDPATAWPQVQVPALVLFGGQDPTVPTATSLEIVQSALARNRHPGSRVVVFPERGHALGGPARNQDAAYTALVPGWIRAVTQGEPMPEMPFPDTQTPPGDLRWYGPGADVTPWYGTAGLQLPLILLFLLTFVVTLVASLLPWLRFGGLAPRLALGLAGAVDAFLLVGLLVVLNYLLNADAESFSPDAPLVGWLFPLAWVSLLLAVGLAYLWFTTRRQDTTRVARAVFTWVTLAAWGFVPFLAYWGLLAGRL